MDLEEKLSGYVRILSYTLLGVLGLGFGYLIYLIYIW